MRTWSKALCLLFLLLTLSQIVVSQIPGDLSDQNDLYAEHVVRNALLANGVSFSFTEKEINKLGDRAAIGLIRIIGQEPLANPDQITSMLGILQTAFSAPNIIVSDADRYPRATLFLLTCLKGMPSSRTLAAEIEQVKRFVIARSPGNAPD